MEREEFSGSDLERPLTRSGTEKALQAMKGLSRLLKDRTEVPRSLTSPAIRARQTAEVFWKAYGGKANSETEETLRPGANCLDYLKAMIYSSLGETEALLIFGHEPDISETCALLLNLHRIPDYSRLWNTREPHMETFSELQHWLPSDEGEHTVVEGAMSFQIKKAGAVRFTIDNSGAVLEALLPPRTLRSMA